jgi:hypothetical protein
MREKMYKNWVGNQRKLIRKLIENKQKQLQEEYKLFKRKVKSMDVWLSTEIEVTRMTKKLFYQRKNTSKGEKKKAHYVSNM